MQASSFRLLKIPARILGAAALLCLAVLITLLQWMQQQPALGWQLRSDSGSVWIARAQGFLSPFVGARVVALGDLHGARLELLASDLTEEPDFFDEYAQIQQFLDRQDRFTRWMRAGSVRVYLQESGGAELALDVATAPRHWRLLPLTFWIQVLCGCAGLLISSWVFALRVRDRSAAYFALTGLFLLLSAAAAAVYSSRELALQADWIRALSLINHFGTLGFGVALVGLFTEYPQRLPVQRGLVPLALVTALWWLWDSMHWAPNLDIGIRLPVIILMLCAIAAALVQWRRSRGRPLERASLRWLALSSLVGCSLFVGHVVLARTVDASLAASQAWGFAYFVIMYGGIALGLGRYRLFDLDEWAYRLLVWVGGAAAVVSLDIVLIWLGFAHSVSLGVAVLLGGWLYFPLRQWLWQGLVGSTQQRLQDHLVDLVAMALAPLPAQRHAQWNALLTKTFHPGHLQKVPGAASGAMPTARLVDDGQGLAVDAVGELPAMVLRLADGGKRLFSSRDRALAQALLDLASKLLEGRQAHALGVQQERQRLTQDLHDTLGARLLSLLHQLRGHSVQPSVRECIREMRTLVQALDMQYCSVAHALARWHVEAQGRCDEHRVTLEWHNPAEADPPRYLDAVAYATVESCVRECISNALRHSQPSRLRVEIAVREACLHIGLSHDGCPSDPQTWQDGFGWRHMRSRLDRQNGSISRRPGAGRGEVCVTLVCPLMEQA